MKKYIQISEGLKLILCTTMCIIFLMVMIPSLTIKSNGIENMVKEENVNDKNSNSNITKEIKDIVLDGSDVVKVYIIENGAIEEVNIEDYICGVISSEMPASFEIEALKAQAVAARTYVASKRIKNCTKGNGADVCNSTHCQVYKSKQVRFELWDTSVRDEYWNKISMAVSETKGKVLSYNNELVLYPQFFSTSSGKTENSIDLYWADLPYLKSVESKGEDISPKFSSEKVISVEKFINIFTNEYGDSSLNVDNIRDNIQIISKSEAGSVKEIKIAGESIRGQDFRFLFGLNSSNFSYEFKEGDIVFNCKGYGHGVGMSQWGANVMAKESIKYEEILKHYYTGIEITNLEFNQ